MVAVKRLASYSQRQEMITKIGNIQTETFTVPKAHSIVVHLEQAALFPYWAATIVSFGFKGSSSKVAETDTAGSWLPFSIGLVSNSEVPVSSPSNSYRIQRKSASKSNSQDQGLTDDCCEFKRAGELRGRYSFYRSVRIQSLSKAESYPTKFHTIVLKLLSTENSSAEFVKYSDFRDLPYPTFRQSKVTAGKLHF